MTFPKAWNSTEKLRSSHINPGYQDDESQVRNDLLGTAKLNETMEGKT